ncbi:polysaccharide biosynthesis tyrosine autokinase [Variovorax sp. J22R115]|uniref:polysaccharide biosynthesis tyrosine autokinase n=1 Tax=Variovorax sp. J22R115 TaxID=3053509 RepID=UPI002574B606|nr:polysaccharide biosynthesis tyrosine autokinase [Variovorax sp. J22R115]MDM0053459.1 polysaccharide biosynthesis tyrosine autokinase [Variovorax sp. J22R115]
MNPAQPNPPGTQRQAGAGDEINLLELLDVVLDNRWLIASVMVFATLIGLAYALISTPIYQANTMVQVEDSKGDMAGSMLGQASSLFDIRSPASAEMQILRSRLVVGQVVENLHLDVEVTPKYLPVLGRWLAKRAKEPSSPGFLGLSGFVSGNESLKVAAFEVPEALEGKRFRVRLVDQGYELLSPDSDVVGQGRVGQPLAYAVDGEKGSLLVVEAVGKPGAEFYVTRFLPLNVTEDLQKDLRITEEGKQSGVIRATLEGDDAREIARVLNEIGSLYVRQNIERKAAEAEKSLNFLGSFLPELRQQMEASESKFNKFRNRNSTFDLGTEGKLVLEQSVKLQTSLLELQQKRKELRALYTPEHHSIKALDAQIASINAELGGLSSRVKTLPDIEQELLSLTRDVKVNNELYVSLLNSSQQLRLVKEGKVGNVRIVDVAAVPRKPVKPQRALVVALAAVLGLLLGLALAFLRNSLRPGLKDPADIEQRAGLHVFASIPHSEAQVRQAQEVSKKVPGSHVLAVAAPQEPAVESLRSLRTALQFAMLDAANNIILITGPTPGIGKSFTSVNLAAVLGAANKKVLLIDADLRKGHLNQYFGLPRERGMSEVVSGSVKFDEAVHRQVAPNVDFLSTGILPPNPAELLMTPASPALVQEAAQHYDLIIIDTPPVLAASDTAILAPLAGAVFLIARAEVTSLGELQESAKRLLDTGVKAKGVIFNGLNMSKRRYGYGIGYKYGGYRYTNYKY